jgi:hypothetical protein
VVLELRFGIQFNYCSKYGKYQVHSGEVQWEEQFLSLVDEDEGSFDSSMSLQGITRKGEET